MTGFDFLRDGIDAASPVPPERARALVASAPRTAGRPRLVASPALSDVSPASTPTGVDLWTDADLVAPWAGEIAGSSTERLVLALRELVLTLVGHVQTAVDRGARVAAGERLTRGDGHVHIAVRRTGAPEPPPLVRPEYASGRLAPTADPAPLLGHLPTAPEAADLLDRRAASLADVQEHHYADPPRIERGRRHHLAATDGRRVPRHGRQRGRPRALCSPHGHVRLLAAPLRQPQVTMWRSQGPDLGLRRELHGAGIMPPDSTGAGAVTRTCS